jgi:hypothetical protein
MALQLDQLCLKGLEFFRIVVFFKSCVEDLVFVLFLEDFADLAPVFPGVFYVIDVLSYSCQCLIDNCRELGRGGC